MDLVKLIEQLLLSVFRRFTLIKVFCCVKSFQEIYLRVYASGVYASGVYSSRSGSFGGPALCKSRFGSFGGFALVHTKS